LACRNLTSSTRKATPVSSSWAASPRERHKERTIGRPEQRAARLPAEHEELMAQHEQLDVFAEIPGVARLVSAGRSV